MHTQQSDRLIVRLSLLHRVSTDPPDVPHSQQHTEHTGATSQLTATKGSILLPRPTVMWSIYTHCKVSSYLVMCQVASRTRLCVFVLTLITCLTAGLILQPSIDPTHSTHTPHHRDRSFGVFRVLLRVGSHGGSLCAVVRASQSAYDCPCTSVQVSLLGDDEVTQTTSDQYNISHMRHKCSIECLLQF